MDKPIDTEDVNANEEPKDQFIDVPIVSDPIVSLFVHEHLRKSDFIHEIVQLECPNMFCYNKPITVRIPTTGAMGDDRCWVLSYQSDNIESTKSEKVAEPVIKKE